MAIEFNCPYCTTSIRVPDSAAGKRGTCPRCHTKILVPKPKNIPRKAAAPAAESPPADSPRPKSRKRSLVEQFVAEEPDFSRLGETATGGTAPPADSSGSVGILSASATDSTGSFTEAISPASAPAADIPPADRPAVSIARTLRKRRRRSALHIWVPVLCGLLLVGGVALFFYLNRKKALSGTLQAVAVAEEQLPPRTLSTADLPGTPDERAAVLQRLAEYQRFRRYTVAAFPEEKPTELRVRVVEYDGLAFFRVDLSQNRALLDFFKDNADELDKPRREKYRRGLKTFFEDAVEVVKSDGPIPDHRLQQFQNQVLANALVGSEGYHLVASVAGTAYLCAFQDGLTLYYLLPKETTSFILRGRTQPNGERLFPGRFVVRVRKAGKQQPPAAESPPEENAPAKKPDHTNQPGEKKKTDAGGPPASATTSAKTRQGNMPSSP